jgi:hypothetical protein
VIRDWREVIGCSQHRWCQSAMVQVLAHAFAGVIAFKNRKSVEPFAAFQLKLVVINSTYHEKEIL